MECPFYGYWLLATSSQEIHLLNTFLTVVPTRTTQWCKPFPLFSHFFVVVCLRCVLHHMLSLIVYTFRENREFVFISIVQYMMSANSRIRFVLQIVFVCLYITPSHYHHCASFIWRHWTYKMPVRYNLPSVWVRLSIFSQLSIIQYVGPCVFSLPIHLWWLWWYILCRIIIIIKSEVWTITHCLGLGHETMVCTVCLSIFLCKQYIKHLVKISPSAHEWNVRHLSKELIKIMLRYRRSTSDAASSAHLSRRFVSWDIGIFVVAKQPTGSFCGYICRRFVDKERDMLYAGWLVSPCVTVKRRCTIWYRSRYGKLNQSFFFTYRPQTQIASCKHPLECKVRIFNHMSLRLILLNTWQYSGNVVGYVEILGLWDAVVPFIIASSGPFY